MAVGTIAFFKEKRCFFWQTRNPAQLKNLGPFTKRPTAGSSMKKTGKEIFHQDDIVSINEHIGRSTCWGELFLATTHKGKMIVRVVRPTSPTYSYWSYFRQRVVECRHPFGTGYYFDSIYGDYSHEIIRRGDFGETLIGKWIKRYYPESNPDDWYLIKHDNGCHELVNPLAGDNLKVIFSPTKKGRRMALRDPYSLGHRGDYYSCGIFRPEIELYTDPKLGMCMRIGRYMADEDTLRKQQYYRPVIIMYSTSALSNRPFPDLESSEKYESAKERKRYRRNQIIIDIILAATAPILLVFLLLGIVVCLIRLLWRKIRPLWRKIRPLRRESCVKRPIVADNIGDPLKDGCYEGTGYPLLDTLFDLYMTLFFA